LIETDNTGSARDAQIASDASGNALAVWQQYDGSRDNIWARPFTPSGGWGTAILLETNTAYGSLKPQIAMNASGYAAVVWEQSDGTQDSIWANVYR
jgi:hypothetical protein